MDDRFPVEQLDAVRDRVVPVIGAGLALDCRAPSSGDLASELAYAAGTQPSEGANLYAVANDLEQRYGTSWVQEHVAQIVLQRTLSPSPVLLAVTLINRRLVATTNYDDAIEEAARRHGLTPRTLLPRDLPAVIEGPEADELLVLHLHGTAHEPGSIVLTESTYTAAEKDAALQQAAHHLAAGSTLVFLGHRLATNEVHLRRDIKRTVELFGAGDHLLLHADGALTDPSGFEAATGVRPIAYPNPDGDHRLLVPMARRLGAPPLSTPGARIPSISAPVERAYEPMPVAPASEVESDEQRLSWHYGWLFKEENPPSIDDVESSQLLVLGRPGTGKTQALLHLAKERPNAVYLRLGGVSAPTAGQEPPDILVRWVNEAGGSHHSLPRVTRTTLNEEAYDFLLDGLDEPPASRRRELVKTIGALATTMPQHRWVLSTRRVPEIADHALDHFERWELAPTREWVLRYARQHGINETEFNDVLDGAPALADLIDVPLFAAATVELIKDGKPVPPSPLKLLLAYASRSLENEETRLGADPDATDAWLDRLALVTLCAGADSATSRDVVAQSLLGPLPPEVTTDWLIARVLLVESGGRLRFPVRAIRDARAIRELCRLPHGPQIFEAFGVVTLAGERHLRPDWQYAADLLATAGTDWRVLVGSVDPLTAARATDRDCTNDERVAAAAAILDWYREHRIFIPRTREGQLRDDLEALKLLADSASLGSVVIGLVDDLSHTDPANRANAVAGLSAFDAIDDLIPNLNSLLQDDNGVVRRRAAGAIVDHHLSAFAEQLIDLSLNDADELSRRTLADAGIRVADDTNVEGFVERLPQVLRRKIQLSVDERMAPSQQLAVLARLDRSDHEWLEHLVEQHHLPWAPGEVEQIAELWLRAEPHYLSANVQQVMCQHPITALAQLFRSGLDRAYLLDLWPMLEVAEPDALDGLARRFGSQVQRLVHEFRSATARSSQHAAAAPPAPAPAFELDAAVALGDLDAILVHRVSTEDFQSLSPSVRSELKRLIDEAWFDARSGTTALLRIERTAPRQWAADPRDFQLADLALRTGRGLSEQEWFKAVELTPHDEVISAHLQASFDPAWEPAARDALRTMDADTVDSLIKALPAPWTHDTAEAIAARAFTVEAPRLHAAAAEALAAQGHIEVLTAWAPRVDGVAIDSALAGAGVADAERRLLVDFERRGFPSLEHWGDDTPWINVLSDPASASLIGKALRAMLRRGDEAHELTPLFHALNRCRRDDAAAIYNSMIADTSIPSAPFLWYRKQELVGAQPRPVGALSEVITTIYGEA